MVSFRNFITLSVRDDEQCEQNDAVRVHERRDTADHADNSPQVLTRRG